MTETNLTSARKAVANRANAQKSTGPKTAYGKKKSAKNATRHGLTRGRNASDPEARALASALTELDGLAPGFALTIAEAFVRQTKALRAAEVLIANAVIDDAAARWEELENSAQIQILDRLVALSDYERRAAATLGKQLRKV